MGEKEGKGEKETEKKGGEGNDGDQKKKRENKEEGIELKVDMHCEGCANKLKKAITSCLQGVDKISVDSSHTKLKVIGNVDPWKIKEFIESKTNKKVEFISPKDPPKKKADDAGADSKPAKADKEEENKSDEKKTKPLPVCTVLLKIRLHCDGCIDRIKRTIQKIKGVDEVIVDKDKNVVTVKGTMDVKAMPELLQNKLKRTVEIVQPNKDKEKSGSGSAAGGEKEKKKEGGEKAEAAPAVSVDTMAGPPVAEINKMEYRGFGYVNGYENLPANGYVNGYEQYLVPNYGYANGHNNEYGAYDNYGYRIEMVHAPQTFSDENPNACSVM